jgi:hypothetical protein
MNFARADFQHIKWGVLAFSLSLLVGGSAIWLGAEYVDHTLKQRQSAQKQLNEARNALDSAQSDLENMSIYAQEYDALAAKKIIGDEPRLDWMEGLETLRQQHRVIDFRYTISPQQPYTPNPALDTGDFGIKLSSVNLQMDLLHEGQLIDFFEALRSDSKGWFIVDRCTLERLDSGNVPSLPSRDAQLKADCSGGWITLNNRSAP